MDNKSQFFSTKKAIIKWLDEYCIKNYTINDDLSVDVSGEVDISHQNLELIPIKFRKITGNFWCNNNKLTNLTGSPKTVGGNFYCGYNQIINLIGSPEVIGGSFSCYNNNLVNLIGTPKFVGGSFGCENNPLTSLLEANNCVFNDGIYLDIDEVNFKQKEFVKILKKYWKNSCYVLTKFEFQGIIQPILQKKILKQKLQIKHKRKTKKSFL